mmetsp:Transcript_57749/g.94846  ORF Transcript_57749/g.94846 Transcript_57749/m.94846 type:complete len:217 (+) Transcript_57749:34-684(+)
MFNKKSGEMEGLQKNESYLRKRPKAAKRYYALDEHVQMRCNLCGMQGHTIAACPNKYCIRCGQLAHGKDSRCERIWCDECKVLGHSTMGCPWRRSFSNLEVKKCFCFECGLQGHLSCGSATSEAKRVSQPGCSNCGSKEHTVRECTLECFRDSCREPALLTNYEIEGDSDSDEVRKRKRLKTKRSQHPLTIDKGFVRSTATGVKWGTRYASKSVPV